MTDRICQQLDCPMKRTAPPPDGVCPKCNPPTYTSNGTTLYGKCRHCGGETMFSHCINRYCPREDT